MINIYKNALKWVSYNNIEDQIKKTNVPKFFKLNVIEILFNFLCDFTLDLGILHWKYVLLVEVEEQEVNAKI